MNKTIKISKSERTGASNFVLSSENMERYEIIGILRLSILNLERQCLSETGSNEK